jgi:phosphatidylethanolamine-binding protein (PEBP) family uncharacterized protein
MSDRPRPVSAAGCATAPWPAALYGRGASGGARPRRFAGRRGKNAELTSRTPRRVARHRYFHKIYALDTVLSGLEHPTKVQLLNALKGHVLAEAQLVGTYQ